MSYRKEDWGYAPSDGETLKAYSSRMKSIAQQIRHDYTQQHLKWYTHYSAGPCYICNLMDLIDYCVEIVEMVPLSDKKAIWSLLREKGSTDILQFTLHRRNVR